MLDRTRLVAASIGLLLARAAVAGDPAVDPDGPLASSALYERGRPTGNVAVVWTDNTRGLIQKSWDYAPPEQGLNAGLLGQDLNLLATPQEIGFYQDQPVDLVQADFDDDGFAEWVAAWERYDADLGGERIQLSVPQDLGRNGPTDPATGQPTIAWTQLVTADVQDDGWPAPHQPWDFERLHQLRLAPGDLDGDGLPELVLAYWNASGNIQLVVYEFDGTKVPRSAAGLEGDALPSYTVRPSGESLPTNATATRSTKLEVTTGDFDGDDVDEIVVIGVDATGNTWTTFSRLYEYDAATGLSLVALGTSFLTGSGTQHLEGLVVTAGDFDGDEVDEVAVGYNVDESTITSNLVGTYWVQLLRRNPGPSGNLITMGTRIEHAPKSGSFSTQGGPMGIVASDLDGDGDDEVALAARLALRVYDWEGDALTELAGVELPETFSGFGQGDSPRRRILDAGDLDAGAGPGPDRPELVYASEDWSLGDAGVLVQVYALDDLGGGAFDLPLRAELVDETSPGLFAQPSWAVTVGAFDGPDVRLGAPDVSTVTEITQPLVLLQAPPVHFDILSGIPFDLNDCFPPMVCDFRSTYERRDVIQSSVVAEFHADWVLSEELEGDVSLGGTTVAGSLASTFGVGFSKVEEERRVETFEVVQTADLDDWIYAATVTYDLWEYPVFVGGDTQPSGHVLVVRPRLGGAGGVRLRWFNSKSWTAQSFLPDHEVGNVLSYRAIARPDEANGYAEEVRWATSDARGLTAQGGGGLWSIALQDVSVVTRSYESFWDVEQDFSVEGVVEFPIEAFDPGSVRLKASVAGTYGESAVSTLSMSVDNSLGLHFDFGPLASGIGETEYSVTPYAYWAKNGALVLAYAAEVGEAGPGGTDTWWDANYKSAPDPTFILPWKYDPEKGFPVQDEAKRQQTRDIRLEPSDARTGDVVEIQARIQNYSLVDAPSVGVRFYLGDPQDGGTRIFGETPGEIVTGVIPRRESKVVSMRWRIPHDLDTNTARIYAVIDPSFDLVELQETNNTGWAPFVIPAPEPGRGLLAAAALLSLGWIRGRNRC